jgi:hypothetical protein
LRRIKRITRRKGNARAGGVQIGLRAAEATVDLNTHGLHNGLDTGSEETVPESADKHQNLGG